MRKKTFAAVHKAIYAGVVRACHDLSEGGLAVAAAEMAFAGGLGVKINLQNVKWENGNTAPSAAALCSANRTPASFAK